MLQDTNQRRERERVSDLHLTQVISVGRGASVHAISIVSAVSVARRAAGYATDNGGRRGLLAPSQWRERGRNATRGCNPSAPRAVILSP